MEVQKSSDLTMLFFEHANISGCFTPDLLFTNIIKECGKVDYLAVLILSDIIYWHRPSKDGVRRFKGDLLQKSYDTYAKKFNAPKRTVKASFDLLEELGFIKRYFKTVIMHNNQKASNVMFVELNLSKIIEIFNQADCDVSNKGDFSNDSYSMIKVLPSNKKEQITISECENSDSYDNILEEDVQDYEVGHTEKCNTYTETNNKNISKNIISFIPENKTAKNDGMSEDQIRKTLADNVEIDALINEQPLSADAYREYFEIMVDLCCHNKKSMKIHGNTYSAEAVKNRILNLRREHLEYVCEKYDNYVGKITDYYAHVTATLYYSYFEVNNYLSNLRRNVEYESCI